MIVSDVIIYILDTKKTKTVTLFVNTYPEEKLLCSFDMNKKFISIKNISRRLKYCYDIEVKNAILSELPL